MPQEGTCTKVQCEVAEKMNFIQTIYYKRSIILMLSLPLPMSEASVHPCCATRKAKATANSDTDEVIISNASTCKQQM